MADIKISELGAASAVNNTDLFPMTSSGVTVKATAQQIKNYMGVGNLTDLNTTDKSSVVAAINEVDAAINEVDAHADNAQASANIVQGQVSDSGDAYSSSKAYVVGDLCIYNNKLYCCITACSAGSWATNQSCFIVDTLTHAVNAYRPKILSITKTTSNVGTFTIPLTEIPNDLHYIIGIYDTTQLNYYVVQYKNTIFGVYNFEHIPYAEQSITISFIYV